MFTEHGVSVSCVSFFPLHDAPCVCANRHKLPVCVCVACVCVFVTPPSIRPPVRVRAQRKVLTGHEKPGDLDHIGHLTTHATRLQKIAAAVSEGFGHQL